MILRLSEVALWTHGGLSGKDLMVRGVATDTRQAMPGALFVALKGDNFDGHDFVEKAKEAGAVALLVAKPVASELPQVVVADTLLALGDLASHARAQQRAISLAAVPLITAFGRKEHDGRGAIVYLMTHDAVERIARIVGRSAALERLKGVYVVTDSETGAVITICHSW